MSSDPGVEAGGQPREPGSQEQRADGTPYRTTGAQGRGDRRVTAGNLTVLTDPLNRLGALLCGEMHPL